MESSTGAIPAGILHVCGGDPNHSQGLLHSSQYSPRMWRWSSVFLIFMGRLSVFSTYVEVIPCIGVGVRAVNLYSPRMWRWSRKQFLASALISVFSTYVEVIPWRSVLPAKSKCILHVCGGDPSDHASLAFSSLYSPRMWRWSSSKQNLALMKSVFSTYVEVIPYHLN